MNAPSARYRYGPSRRLHLRRDTARVFAKGRRAIAFPYRAMIFAYAAPPDQKGGVRLMVNAPKRLFKRAVDRNAQRRRVREIFRQTTAVWHRQCEARGVRVDMAILLISNEPTTFQKAQKSIERIVGDAKRYAKQLAK